ncbi:TPA: fimbrial protein [Serratia fonticola]|uniref:fimbrial protein n=1 Tax=Serratia fonticola TaxID=47917 RepID=UPI00217C83D5|nr:fimbrial protein [Serratia fonticola]CAI1543189.1 Minor fimbrial protein prsF precursor [Serratia fonticola]CAI1731466.1 Minor fimbrial protein prsF precursor [Serratia fonticola]CAI1995802.1 Minor fimbrial protein prsF precursor [Serratia fonticola]CAI2002407.1 Minor fimbrial protein prsF precursor [Serratia fonticola]
MTSAWVGITQRVPLAQLCLSCALLLPGTLAQAVTTVTVRITVVAPPCVINGGGTLEVDFGNDVLTNRVDGSNYRRPIPYSVQCSGNTTNAMTLQIQGSQAGFGYNVLQTNKADLGIALFITDANIPLPFDMAFQFTYPKLLVLSAAPIKRPGSTLTAGTFSAGATLKVDYQ